MRILRWEGYLDYPSEPIIITRVLVRKGLKSLKHTEDNVTREAEGQREKGTLKAVTVLTLNMEKVSMNKECR